MLGHVEHTRFRRPCDNYQQIMGSVRTVNALQMDCSFFRWSTLYWDAPYPNLYPFINKNYRSVHSQHCYLTVPARPSICVHLFRSIFARFHCRHRPTSCDEKSSGRISDKTRPDDAISTETQTSSRSIASILDRGLNELPKLCEREGLSGIGILGKRGAEYPAH